MKATHRSQLLPSARHGLHRHAHGRPAPPPRTRRRSATAPRWTVALLSSGMAVFAAGAFGDLAYHAFPGTGIAAFLEPLAGSDGARAHAITLAGMVAIAAGLLVRGLTMSRKREPEARSPPHRGRELFGPEYRQL